MTDKVCGTCSWWRWGSGHIGRCCIDPPAARGTVDLDPAHRLWRKRQDDATDCDCYREQQDEETP